MRVAIFGLNGDQIPYLKEAKNLGLEVVGFDLQPEPPGKYLVDTFIQVGYEATESIWQELGQLGFSAEDRLFTAASQFAHLSISLVAAEFSIPYPDFQAVRTVVSKFLLYPFLKSNSVPVPETRYFRSESSLLDALRGETSLGIHYLKSDRSKNPHHVFFGTSAQLLELRIPWTKDRYLGEGYVLQPEFVGQHLRVNLLRGRVRVFEFSDGVIPRQAPASLVGGGVVKSLERISRALGMENWLLKFDLVMNEDTHVVLDIGIDPPSRLISQLRSSTPSGEARYLRHYLGVDNNSLAEILE